MAVKIVHGPKFCWVSTVNPANFDSINILGKFCLEIQIAQVFVNGKVNLGVSHSLRCQPQAPPSFFFQKQQWVELAGYVRLIVDGISHHNLNVHTPGFLQFFMQKQAVPFINNPSQPRNFDDLFAGKCCAIIRQIAFKQHSRIIRV